jgi:phenylalanyl-tRNA synthetase beta chain
VLRQRLLPSLLRVVDANLRQGRDDVAIFEVGKGYGAEPDGTADRTREWWRLGIALAGRARPPHWADQPRDWDLDDAKGLVALVAERLGLARPTFASLTDDPTLHPGRAALVRAAVEGGGGDEPPGLAGRVGVLHPQVAESLDLRSDVVVAELSVRGLSAGLLEPVRLVPPARHPAVERDLAIVVAEDVPAATVVDAIRSAGGTLLADVRLFDVYRGAPLETGAKSLAHRLVFQADRTLTEDEVDRAIAAIVEGVATPVGGRVRT